MATFQPIDVTILNRGFITMQPKNLNPETSKARQAEASSIVLNSASKSTVIPLNNTVIWLKLGNFHYKIWQENGFVNFQRYKNPSEPTKAQIFQILSGKAFIIGQKPITDNITRAAYQVFDTALPDEALKLETVRKEKDIFLQAELLADNLQAEFKCQPSFSDKGGCPFNIPLKKV